MGLRTQLYALDDPVVSPCYREDYTSDHTKQAIGETAYQIPLPWLAMFRPGDIREERIAFGEDGESEVRKAPVTTMSKAAENLISAAGVVRKAFPECPMLANYLEIMVEELALFRYPFVTIDATELYPEILARGELRDPWRAVLSGFESPERVAEFVPLSVGDRIGMLFGRARKDPWLKAINNFVEFSPSDSLPYPDYKIRGVKPTPEEIGRHGTLLPGEDYHRSVWDLPQP